MKSNRCLIAAVVVGLIVTAGSRGQEFPKPGPEHEMLKKMEGTWDAKMTGMGMESKGTMVYKMELGGLFLTSTFEGDFGGQKFTGKGFDGYDSMKKKFVGVWVDSMSFSPMMMEGTYDKDKKQLTMTGEGPGLDGKPTKHKMVTEFKDADTMIMNMFMGDTKDPGFTIVFTRKK